MQHLLMSLGIKLVIFQTVNYFTVPLGASNSQMQFELAQIFLLSLAASFLVGYR